MIYQPQVPTGRNTEQSIIRKVFKESPVITTDYMWGWVAGATAFTIITARTDLIPNVFGVFLCGMAIHYLQWWYLKPPPRITVEEATRLRAALREAHQRMRNLEQTVEEATRLRAALREAHQRMRNLEQKENLQK